MSHLFEGLSIRWNCKVIFTFLGLFVKLYYESNIICQKVVWKLASIDCQYLLFFISRKTPLSTLTVLEKSDALFWPFFTKEFLPWYCPIWFLPYYLCIASLVALYTSDLRLDIAELARWKYALHNRMSSQSQQILNRHLGCICWLIMGCIKDWRWSIVDLSPRKPGCSQR